MIRFVAINDYGNHFYLDNIHINGQNILSISEVDQSLYTIIYPNPTKGIFTIKSNVNYLEMEIFSSIGKVIRKEIIQGGSKKINLQEMRKGIYLIKLKYNEKTEERKLIIQ